MKTLVLSALAAALLATTGLAQTLPPAAPSVPASDVYFGTKVDDPYRNLENLDDAAVQQWMKAQALYARQTLEAIPGRASLLRQMQEIDTRQSARITRLHIANNDRYFYLKTRPEDQQPKLYCRDGYQGQEALLFDPENFEQGKTYTVNALMPSWDGSKVAFKISEKGAEVGQLLILDVRSRQLYPERLGPTAIGGISWLPDNSRLAYTRMNNADIKSTEARLNTQAYLHKTGTSQNQDQAYFSNKAYPELGIKPEEYPEVYYDQDTRLAFGFQSTVDRYLSMHYLPASALSQSRPAWKRLCTPDQEVTNLAGNAQYLYFTTSKGTPREKIMRTSAAQPDVAHAEVVVPESPDEALVAEELRVTADGLYFVRTRNGVEARLYFLPHGSKAAVPIALPAAAGSVQLQTKNAQSADLWVSLSGWTTSRTRYRYAPATRQFVSEPLSTEISYPEFADLTVEELLVPSHDGVLVPLSLIYRKGLARNGSAPVLMVGYGSYSASTGPFFFPPYLLWAQQGGVLAVPHVRGGGELGEAWHKAGQKATKPNTWKDLIACAEYLVQKSYTAPGKLAINGVSAGGILIGRAMTERPDLFAVAIPEVGCLNAVRMENSPNGPANTPEFGTVAREDECRGLLEMDAYLHLQQGVKYPATLITAGINDPRVIAWQPAKFAARLQASTASGKPVLFFTDYEAGHGIGDSKQKQFDTMADLLAFGLWQTGHAKFQMPAMVTK
ncbi:prolyl oligopeptidase family serine peptidase [Hymenobacter saemangeumensis]|uniref:prolyl oligopeptidase n=1 Tax=Hymenobacter saemangeumensis TaxID=1084522 RepID=A0ABP8ILW4_9BACT